MFKVSHIFSRNRYQMKGEGIWQIEGKNLLMVLLEC